MKSDRIVEIALILIVVSHLLDWLYPAIEGNTTGRVVPQIILLISLFILIGFLLFSPKKKIEFKLFPLSLFLWIILSSFYALFYNRDGFNLETVLVLSKLIIWPLFGIIFYFLALNTNLRYDLIFRWAFILSILLCSRSLYLLVTSNFQLEFGSAETRELANSNTYLLLWLIPFLWLKKSDKISKIGLVLIFLILFLSMKRGPILALLASIFVSNIIFETSVKKKIGFFLIIPITLIGVYYLASQFYPQFLERFDDLSSPETSLGHGRFEFWGLLFNYYAQADIVVHIFGFGFFEVPDFLSTHYMDLSFAHSDWIEILFDFGLIGIFLFVLIHFTILKEIGRSFRFNLIAKSLLFSWVLFFMSNIYTMSTMNKNTIWLFIFLGYWVGIMNQNSNYTKRAFILISRLKESMNLKK
ncbi:O-antigen ligase family protein [Gaoshiqia sp. Z1-71]|uniref:O-antigen ligase family protein n=1 Tax=Gaoshiqia hydrogeniformans TaxID=3290090 RepID=UPI003BF8B8C8